MQSPDKNLKKRGVYFWETKNRNRLKIERWNPNLVIEQSGQILCLTVRTKTPFAGVLPGFLTLVFQSVAMSDPICGLEHIHPLPKGHQGSHVVSNTIYQLETWTEMDRTFNNKPVSVLQCLASPAAILLVRTFKLTIAYIGSCSALTLMRVYTPQREQLTAIKRLSTIQGFQTH